MEYSVGVVKLDSFIAKEKNRLLKDMLQGNFSYFFLIEDNCKVLNGKVYNAFIDTSKSTGIEALMWAKGGPNRNLGFEDDPYIEYWSDFVTAFTMYTRNAIETVGLFDEDMPPNTWQELAHAKAIGDAELSTPFGMFASPKDIDKYLEITFLKNEFQNLKQMEEALKYWEAKDMEDFPIEVKDQKRRETMPITEMI